LQRFSVLAGGVLNIREKPGMNKYSALSLLLAAALLAAGCPEARKNDGRQSMTVRQDINAVKEAHTPELMKIPGVAGVYIGESDSGTAFIGVMADSLTEDLRRKIPAEIEGYPVRLEETGPIELR
jgi:hypothetical protein